MTPTRPHCWEIPSYAIARLFAKRGEDSALLLDPMDTAGEPDTGGAESTPSHPYDALP